MSYLSALLHALRTSAADGVEFTEQRRCCFPIGVKKDIFEQCSHEMQVVQAKSAAMGLLGEEEDDLSEVVSNEAFI